MRKKIYRDNRIMYDIFVAYGGNLVLRRNIPPILHPKLQPTRYKLIEVLNFFGLSTTIYQTNNKRILKIRL